MKIICSYDNRFISNYWSSISYQHGSLLITFLATRYITVTISLVTKKIWLTRFLHGLVRTTWVNTVVVDRSWRMTISGYTLRTAYTASTRPNSDRVPTEIDWTVWWYRTFGTHLLGIFFKFFCSSLVPVPGTKLSTHGYVIHSYRGINSYNCIDERRHKETNHVCLKCAQTHIIRIARNSFAPLKATSCSEWTDAIEDQRYLRKSSIFSRTNYTTDIIKWNIGGLLYSCNSKNRWKLWPQTTLICIQMNHSESNILCKKHAYIF